MFLKIIDEFRTQTGVTVFALSTGKIVCAFALDLIDLEQSEEIALRFHALSETLKSLSSKATARFWLLSQAAADGEATHSRAGALASLGSVDNRAYLIFEIEGSKLKDLKLLSRKESAEPLELKATELLSTFDLSHLKSQGVRLRSLNRTEFESLLPKIQATAVTKTSFGLDIGDYIVGVVRLVNLGTTPLTPHALGQLKDRLPLPLEIRVSVKRLNQERSEAILRRKSAQVRDSQNAVGAKKYQEAEEALTDVALMGANLFEFEMLIELKRSDEKTLRRDMSDVVQSLKALGDFAIETVGAFPSFLASQIGFDQHVTILENDQILPNFLPLWSEGESWEFREKPKAHSLALLRRDETLSFFDVFNHKFDNFSVCIFGKSGSGKSVLTNLLTRALLHDPEVRMMKVDVGGSHSKETELLGGVEYQLSMRKPSGLNPFQFFGERHSEDVCKIIATFLGILLIEEGEKVLSKALRGEIEKAVAAYSLSKPSKPSIDDFYAHAIDLPRRALLARWVSGGAYQNAFACNVPGAISEARIRPTSPLKGRAPELDREAKSALIAAGPPAFVESQGLGRPASSLEDLATELDREPKPALIAAAPPAASLLGARLKYYNLSEIFQAADGDYAQGIMAAIVAVFNLELINCKGSRLAFVADETPFFIERCFPFFKFSTANVRKFGGSFITIAQKSSDVVVNGDSGILENSNSKFLFSIDGDKESFAKRLKLTSDQVERIENLRSQKGSFSEALLVDNTGARVVRMQLTHEEYWSATSSHDDQRKLTKLREAVPNLSLNEAIRVLSIPAES